MGSSEGLIQAGDRETLQTNPATVPWPVRPRSGRIRARSGIPQGTSSRAMQAASLCRCPPLDAELRAAVKKLRNGRAGGESTMRAEDIKSWLRGMEREEEATKKGKEGFERGRGIPGISSCDC